ncbi:major facilitator superfamily domain-containing protein [Spinellus fusiger]|nr:major facilitator superfamily domain-containing protein [Spinellus fusiger]
MSQIQTKEGGGHSVEQVEDISNTSFKTKLTKLKNSIYHKPEKTPNAWHLLTNLNHIQRLTFTSGFIGWTLDAFDFFSVSLTTVQIAEDFGVEPSQVTSAITTTLMLRPIGALIFGALADKFGRRWPLMGDLLLFSVINLASGFAPNLQTFIGLRAIFGIAMGGEWGLGTSLALETLPVEARGLFSGIYQQGYATGYLLATLVSYPIIQTNSSWRIMFWAGSGFSIFAIIIRLFVPESKVFEKTKEARKVLGRSLLKETWVVLKHHWLRFAYMVILMAFMNFLSHGSQDLYPTFLQSQLGYTTTQKTVTSVIYNVGAICGGTIIGYYSNYFGRRFSIAFCALMAGAFIPLWIFGPNIQSLQFGAFVLQFFVQGAWGVIPAHINELSPPAFRGLLPGLSYQLGNLISAASSQIQAVIGEKYPIQNPDGSFKLDANGKKIANYGLTQAIFMACVCVCLIVTALVGKEERNKDFTKVELEDDRSGHAIGPVDISELSMEQGNSDSDPEKKTTNVHNSE